MKDIIVLNYIDLSKRDKNHHDRHVRRVNRRTWWYHFKKRILGQEIPKTC